MDHTFAEAEHQLSELIDRAIAGEGVVITRDGKPVAALRAVPAPPTPNSGRMTKADFERLAKFRPTIREPAEDAGALVSRMRDEDWDR